MNNKKVNELLRRMREQGKVQDWKAKGSLGEDAVLAQLLDYSYAHGGKIYQSFKYPYASDAQGKNYLGNIKLENGQYIQYTDKKGLEDEIDLLYITKYRIFVIEVKAYHAKIVIDNEWMTKNGTPVDKSPIWQTEKHCRHLYHQLWEVIPNGKTEYIVPICCFVDECTVKDKRDAKYRNYIHVCVLDNILDAVDGLNSPLRYGLQLPDIYAQLSRIKTSVKKEY